jgi:hypothetical protein
LRTVTCNRFTLFCICKLPWSRTIIAVWFQIVTTICGFIQQRSFPW